MERESRPEDGLMDGHERWFINSRAKYWFQKHFEMRIYDAMLRRAGISLRGARVLDAGCGAGHGLKLIRETFCPGSLVGMDLDPEEVEISKRTGAADELFVGDLARTGLPSSGLDAVFVFTVLHHMPRWREGVREVSRLLRDGGVFLLNEHNARSAGLFGSLFSVHHPEEAGFSWDQLEQEIGASGMRILERRSFLGLFNFYLCKKVH